MPVKFLSIKEFFYKLNTIGFILLLLPLLAFTFLYYGTEKSLPMLYMYEDVKMLFMGSIGMIAVILTTVHWYSKNKVRKLKTLIELSMKMDGYYEVFRLRMILYMICSLLLAFCYFLTGSFYFTALFIYIILVAVAQWPSRSSFCRMFDLNENEREMIMLNQDMIWKKNKRT